MKTPRRVFHFLNGFPSNLLQAIEQIKKPFFGNCIILCLVVSKIEKIMGSVKTRKGIGHDSVRDVSAIEW
jgi:hypothetical protein